MLVCNGDIKYKCTKPKTKNNGASTTVLFTVVDAVSHEDIMKLFANDSFYIYDAFLDERLFDANGKRISFFRITYNDDLGYEVKIKY